MTPESFFFFNIYWDKLEEPVEQCHVIVTSVLLPLSVNGG